ncbi:hypothetical protein ACFX13_022191 [Malus domestica]
MAGYERVVIIETVFHRKVAAPIASEHHAIIENCHGVLYKNNSTNMAADEYYDSWPQKMINASSRPPLPPLHQGQHFPPHQQSQIMMQRPVNNVQGIKGNAILTSTEAAKRYGGFVTTEFYPRKHGRPN